MALIVQKFGGTSLATAERIKEVAQIIQKAKLQNNQIIVVVSAMAGITNRLISLCNEISSLDDISNLAEYDNALSTGETMSSSLLALALQELKIHSRSISAWQLPIITNSNHTESLVEEFDCKLIQECLDNNIIPIITGFQGITKNSRTTTIGRGGSDTTAVLAAAAMKAKTCYIYTDVTGVFTTDPRIVHHAIKLDCVNSEEMLELASSGAKVLHARSVELAMRYNVDIRVLSSFNEDSGTLITNEKTMESRIISSIAYNKNLFKLTLIKPKISCEEVLALMAENNIVVDSVLLLSETQYYEFIIHINNKVFLENILVNLKRDLLIKDYKIDTKIAMLALVGFGIKNDINLPNQIFKKLKEINVNILRMIINEVKISILINSEDTEKSVKKLHEIIT